MWASVYSLLGGDSSDSIPSISGEDSLHLMGTLTEERHRDSL